MVICQSHFPVSAQSFSVFSPQRQNTIYNYTNQNILNQNKNEKVFLFSVFLSSTGDLGMICAVVLLFVSVFVPAQYCPD